MGRFSVLTIALTGILSQTLSPSGALAQNVITTFAGTEWLFPADGRPALDAPIDGGYFLGLAGDQQGNYYIADEDNAMVFKVTPDGILHVVAGNGIAAYSGDGGQATAASMLTPQDVAVDASGTMFILDAGGYIRKVTPDGVISTIAGNGNEGFAGDGKSALLAEFNIPYGIALDSAGSIYIADRNNNRIRKITPDGIINTIAGAGQQGYTGDGGPATSAALYGPQSVAVDQAGNVYFAELQNEAVRMVSPQGIISTVVGGPGAVIGSGIPALGAAILPTAVAVDASGRLYISDFYLNRVVVILNGMLYNVAGNGAPGFSGDGGSSYQAMLDNPTGLAFDAAGNLLIGDSDNRRVRRVDSSLTIQTVAGNGQFRFAGEGGPATSATLYLPYGITVDGGGNLYISEPQQSRVRLVTPNGAITTFAGTGVQGFSGDGGPATSAQLNYPTGVAIDPSGALYVADQVNGLIRKVTADGSISTFAGNGALQYAGDGMPATSASLDGPQALAFDSGGALYIAAPDENRVRRVGLDGIISTYAGNGQAGYTGNGGQATGASLNGPAGLTFDAQDNLYIADQGNNVVRKVTPQGIITTVAGNGRYGFLGDGRAATAANLRAPQGLAVDRAGNLYIGDLDNFRIREVTTDGIISTIAGNGTAAYSGDGGPAAKASLYGPISLTFDAAGDLIFADWLNNRVRAILTTPPSFGNSPAALSFSAESGGLAPPLQAVQLAGSIPGILSEVSVAPQSALAWLNVTPSLSFLPAGAQVSADPTNLAAGTYQATVTFQAPYAQPSTNTTAVTFNVSPARPAQLAATPAGLPFSLVQGAPPLNQTITVSNTGGGPLAFAASAATVSGGSWLSISPASGTATPANSPVITVTANPAGLAPGTYSGTVTIASSTTQGSVVIPTVLTVSAAQQTIRLLQAGLTFTAVAGGAVTPPQSFGVQNGGQGVMKWSAAATMRSGGSSWLSVTPASGASDASLNGTPLAQVTANPTGLAAGAYYGQVSIAAPGADNSPQTVAVVLNVLPAGSNPAPIAQPSGLVFTGAAGGESPGSQNITITNLSTATLTFTSSGSALSGGRWFVYLPTAGTIAPQTSARLVVQPDLTGLAAGIYRGSITLLYSNGGSNAIGILLAVTSTPVSASRSGRGAAAGCVASQLIPVISSMADSFLISAAWPTPLEAHVIDDCGNPMTSGSVVATFTNGDPPKALTYTNAGEWSGTWQPVSVSAAPVTVTINAQIPQLSLKGSARVTGALFSNVNIPAITSGAVVSSASFAPQTPIAPGALISILGSSLADSALSSTTPPLQTTLGVTSVLIAGNLAPLVSVSGGRIDAVVPYGVPPNTRQQVIVQRGAVITPPEPVTVASAQPAIFSQDNSGSGQGSVFAVAADGSQTLAGSANPVMAGNRIMIQCAGLGAVNPAIADGLPAPASPPSATVYPVSVSIGGVDAPVSFAGLAPGTVGAYQVNATVPPGVAPGRTVPIVLTVAGQTSPAVTIAVK